MGENLIPYWEAWLNDEIIIPISTNGFIINYAIFNLSSNEGVGDWICCNSKKKVFSFIKYVLLPCVLVNKIIGVQEKTVYLDVSDYNETIEILEETEFDGYKEAIEDYTTCFEALEKLEKEDASWVEIKAVLNYINGKVDIEDGLFVNLQLYENIKSVGKTLIEEYEEQGLLEEFEEIMELKKAEIEELFDNIDKNQFMLKKISALLNSKVIL